MAAMVRIFLSSSFQDMHEERDYLKGHAFAVLRAELRLCLDDVEACAPRLIGLRGDRYGWIPYGDGAEHPNEDARYRARMAVDNIHDAPGLDIGRAGLARQRRMMDEIEHEMAGHPGHVRDYPADWDAEAGCASRLEELNRMVYEDLNAGCESIEGTTDDSIYTPAERYYYALAEKTMDLGEEGIYPDDPIRALYTLITRDGHPYIHVQAPPGGGVTTAMAQIWFVLTGMRYNAPEAVDDFLLLALPAEFSETTQSLYDLLFPALSQIVQFAQGCLPQTSLSPSSSKWHPSTTAPRWPVGSPPLTLRKGNGP